MCYSLKLGTLLVALLMFSCGGWILTLMFMAKSIIQSGESSQPCVLTCAILVKSLRQMVVKIILAKSMGVCVGGSKAEASSLHICLSLMELTCRRLGTLISQLLALFVMHKIT
jgi:hypothetical protein